MIRVVVAVLAALAIVAAPRPGAAQSVVSGSAELDALQSTAQVADRENSNGSFGQSYSVGWTSTLWDPRLIRYNAQGSFRTNGQNATNAGQEGLRGHANDFGYALGANLLQASSMPFFIQASRTRDRSVGDFAPLNQLRGGAVAATGVPASDFESLNHELSLGWHLAAARLPRVEIGYRRASAVTQSGAYQATQDSRDFSGSVAASSSAAHQTLRYQATSSANVLQDTFTQRLGYLDYDFGRTLSRGSRLNVRAGRRKTFSESVFQVPVDITSGAYAPVASNGSASAEYGQVGYAWDPGARYSIHVDGDAEHQAGEAASTSALLATVSSHALVAKGLDLFASGTGGTRQQVVSGVPLAVSTRSANTGVTYQLNGRRLGAGAGATRGIGSNATADGRAGATDSWSGNVHLSATIRRFGANGGYERARFTDAILDFGNYHSEQLRGSVQMQMSRGSLSVDASDVHIARGREATFAQNVQRTLSATSSLRLKGQNFLAATAGRFVNEAQRALGAGTDRNAFWSVNFDGSLRPGLRLSTWLRSEHAFATRTQFSQQGLSGFARLDYTLRTLMFQLEYRRSHSRAFYPGVLGTSAFAGRQVRFSVIRQFGLRVR